MSYVSKTLQPGERVLMLGRLHWIIYKDAAIIFILAILTFWFTGVSPDGGAEGWDILSASGWMGSFGGSHLHGGTCLVYSVDY